MAGQPLLVYGPKSLTYDFGTRHPLSPRRFGPGIELLRAVGAEPGLAPEPSTDAELEWLHSPDYIATVRRFSTDPDEPPMAGIGPGDDPAFAGMHEAAAAVAGGSIRAMEAILRGDVEHAYQPGGGLHHAMRSRAGGFCIYNDVALAIARARRDGLRVLYIDLDVHHGDGVQALHYDDPAVLTISFHESGRSLFPGTGSVAEMGEGIAAATSVNVPLEAACGPEAWLEVHRAAHRQGWKSTATMMYGHVEGPEDVVEHWDRIRGLQDETGGFTAFVPWSWKPDNSVLSRRRPRGAGPIPYLRMIAASRVYLDNFDHVQAAWFSEGKKTGQAALHFGADDFGGTLIEENVHAAAGFVNKAQTAEVGDLIREAGFVPVQRTTRYEVVTGVEKTL